MLPAEPRSEYAATGFSRCAQRCGGVADSGTGAAGGDAGDRNHRCRALQSNKYQPEAVV